MQVELTLEESTFLVEQLRHQLEHVTNELVRTDSRQMQRDLATDERRLKALLAKFLESQTPAAINKLVTPQAKGVSFRRS